MNTGKPKMDERSRVKLRGVHPKLKSVIEGFAAFGGGPFIVTEGLRTTDRQRELVLAGASQTMASKHLVGRAVDLAVVVDGEVRWDWPLYRTLATELINYAAKIHNPPVKLVAGAFWERFPDGPHFELDKSE